jgi:hypothetical protein
MVCLDVAGPVEALAAGSDHSCALSDNGSVRCWGSNLAGQLGTGDSANCYACANAAGCCVGDAEVPSSVPLVDVGGTAVELDAGGVVSCVRLDTGAVRCWGVNGPLGLGDGSAFNCIANVCPLEPQCCVGDDETAAATSDVDVGGTVVELAVAGGAVCVRLDTGAVRCWGSGNLGTLGYGNGEHIGDDEPPAAAGDVPLGGTAVGLEGGGSRVCAILDTGAVRCWGAGGTGALGYGNLDNVGDDETPASVGDVDVGGTVAEISLGSYHTCARLDSGTVRCWGDNTYGQLGYGNTFDVGGGGTYSTPATAGDVDVGGKVIQLATGEFHTCALLESGAVRCWGLGRYGAVGYGTVAEVCAGEIPDFNCSLPACCVGDDETPASAGDVDVGCKVVALTAGARHTCAQLDNGAVRCWGASSSGATGHGSTETIGDDETPASVGAVSVF